MPIIIDTDIYSNVDDVGALAEAYALEMKGVDRVVAIGMNTRTSRPAVATDSWRCVAAVSQWYGFPNVPIGSDMPDSGPPPSNFNFISPCAALASSSTPAPAPVVSVYRKALVAQPDGSVVMVGIGYEENLSALLNSPADSISPLTGAQLIAKKVKTLVITGGGYPTSSGENNLVGNPSAASDVAQHWPTKIVYDGFEVGNVTFTGQTVSSVHPSNSPVRVAIEAFTGGHNKAIRSFDLATMYHVLRPAGPSLTEVGPGTNAINSTTGANRFTTGAGTEYYLSLSNVSGLESSIETLWDTLPGTKTDAVTFTSTPPTSPVVGGTYVASASGGASSNPVTLTIDPATTSGCTIEGAGLVTFTGPPGTCIVDGNQAGDTVYASAPQVQQTITVARAPQSITFTSTPPASPQIGGTYAASATGGGSTRPVTLTIDASSTSGCTIDGTELVTFSGPAGTCVIDANQAGNSNYASAPQVQQSVSVAKIAQSITFTSTPPSSPQVGGTYAAAASGGASSNPVTLTIDGSSTSGCTIDGTGLVTFSGPAGTCVVDANQAGNSSYAAAPQVQQSISVNKGSQSITFTSTNPSPVNVGGPSYTPTATASSGLGVSIALDALSSGCTLSSGIVHFTGVGTCAIDASQAGNSSFQAASSKQQSITITKGTSVISVTSAPSNTRAGTGYQPSATSSSGDTVAIALDAQSTGCILYGNVIWFTSVGTCHVDFSDPGSSNYTASSVQKSYVITKGSVTVKASASPSSARPGARTTLAATLSSTFPTGIVTFKIHSTTLCSATVRGGKATCKESKRLAKGSYTVAANYSGSSSFSAKTGWTKLTVT